MSDRSGASPHAATIIALRAELEETRAALHGFVDRIPRAMWNTRLRDGGWTASETITHVCLAVGRVLPFTIRAARRGRARAYPSPRRFGHAVNNIVAVVLAVGRSSRTAHHRIDGACDRAAAVLLRLREPDLQRTTAYPGGVHTVEQIFREHFRHAREHCARVENNLAGRPD